MTTRNAKGRTVEDLMDDGDMIGALCLAVKEAGLTMTLYGTPVSEPELREHVGGIVDHLATAKRRGG